MTMTRFLMNFKVGNVSFVPEGDKSGKVLSQLIDKIDFKRLKQDELAKVLGISGGSFSKIYQGSVNLIFGM